MGPPKTRRFVPANIMLIERALIEVAYSNLEPRLPEFMGSVFEKICMDYLWEHYYELPISIQATGRWWGNNPKLRQEAEIDIVAGNQNGEAILCECKWRSEPLGESVVDTLLERSELLDFHNCYFYFFSKSGFTEVAKARAEQNDHIRLISLEEILP